MTQLERECKTRQILLEKTIDELSYILGRYCGPHNIILCEKKFGFVLSEKIVKQMIVGASIDEWLISNS